MLQVVLVVTERKVELEELEELDKQVLQVEQVELELVVQAV